MEHHGLLTRKDLLRLAQDEIFNPDFTHQRNARANALMDLSQKIPDGTEERSSPDSAEHRALDDFLRARKESRDLGLSTQTQTTATSVLVDQAFRDEISFALREVDQLHDPDVVTFIRTPKGTPLTIPEMDETSQQAVAILEGAEDDTGTQGDAAADPILACKMSTPPTYRSGFVRASFELVQDTAFPFTDLLMRAFAIRFSRRLGPVLVASLLGSALQGPTVIGDENQDSPDPTSQVGYFDLIRLIRSVDPLYRRSKRAAFVMNDDTLLAIDALVDKVGRPIIRPQYDPTTGRRLLLGYPVAICPSMADPGAGNIPVAFGDLSRFIVRMVEQETYCQVYYEKYVTTGEIGYSARLRADSVLLNVTSPSGSPAIPANSPVKYLQNAS